MSSEPFQSSFGVFSKRWQSSWTSFRGALQSNFNAVWGHLRSNCISQDWTILNQFPNQSKVAILISYDFVAVSITRHWKSSLRAIWKLFENRLEPRGKNVQIEGNRVFWPCSFTVQALTNTRSLKQTKFSQFLLEDNPQCKGEFHTNDSRHFRRQFGSKKNSKNGIVWQAYVPSPTWCHLHHTPQFHTVTKLT